MHYPALQDDTFLDGGNLAPKTLFRQPPNKIRIDRWHQRKLLFRRQHLLDNLSLKEEDDDVLRGAFTGCLIRE